MSFQSWIYVLLSERSQDGVQVNSGLRTKDASLTGNKDDDDDDDDCNFRNSDACVVNELIPL